MVYDCIVTVIHLTVFTDGNFLLLNQKISNKEDSYHWKKTVLIQLHVKWGSNKYKNLYFNHVRENDNLKQQNSNTAENITTKSNMV